jgi:hypothetical protein
MVRSRRYLTKCYKKELWEVEEAPQQHAVRVALVQLIQRATGNYSACLSFEKAEHIVRETLDARILVVLLIELLVVVPHALVCDICKLQHKVVHSEYSGSSIHVDYAFFCKQG